MNSNQQNTNTGQIPNVASVIKASVDNIKASNDALKIIVNSLSATINNLPDDISKHKKTFETLIPMINSYMESVVNVINVLSKDFNGKDFNSLLGIIKERDEDTKKIKTTYTNLDAILKIGEVIDGIVGTVEKVSKNEIKFNSFIKLKLNLILLKHSLNTIIDGVLNSITVDEDMSKKISYLIGSGDKQITLINKTYNEKGEILSDKSKIEDIKSPGGLLTALSLSLDIVNSFNSISFPNLITFLVRIKIFKNRLKIITNGIFDLFDQLVGENSEIAKSNLESFKTTISLINDNLDCINDVLDSIANFNKIHMLSKGATSVFGKYDDNGKRVKDGDLIKIFKGILYFVESREVMAMANKSRFSQMEQIADNISSIMVIIDAVKKIMSSVIIVALLTVPFILACPVILASVWILAGLMYVIHGALVVIGNKTNTKIVEFSVKNIIQQLMWIAGLMILSVGTLAIIALLSPFIIKSAKDTILTIGMIVLVIFAMVAIGALISLISPLIAATTTIMIGLGITIGCVAIIAISLILLAGLKIDENKRKEIKDSVNSIIGTAKDVMNIIFDAFDDPMGENNGNDGLVLSVASLILGDTFVNMIKLVLSCTILIFTTLAVGLVFLTALTLNLLLDNPVTTSVIRNKRSIIDNVNNILGTSKEVINSIFSTFDSPIGDSGDGALLWLAGQILGDTFVNMFKLISSCLALTFTIIAISLVRITAWALTSINDISLDRGKVSSNAQTIMGAARDVIAAVNAPTDSIKEGDKSIGRHILEALLPSSLVNMIDAIMAIGTLGPTVLAVGAVGFMAKQLNSIQELEIKSDIQTRAQAIIASGKDIVKLINDESFKGIDVDDVIERASAMKLVAESINELGKDVNIENHTKLTDNTIRLIDKIDKSKLENLQTAHNMFKEMKEFSESISGNFDGLAEALNEKIAPLLEELKELIGKIPESVDKSASTISTSMYNTTSIASGTATTSTMRAQVQSENPTMSKEDIGKVVDQRMAQQAQSVNKGIEMRLEELLDVLQNYSNPIPVRMS